MRQPGLGRHGALTVVCTAVALAVSAPAFADDSTPPAGLADLSGLDAPSVEAVAAVAEQIAGETTAQIASETPLQIASEPAAQISTTSGDTAAPAPVVSTPVSPAAPAPAASQPPAPDPAEPSLSPAPAPPDEPVAAVPAPATASGPAAPPQYQTPNSSDTNFAADSASPTASSESQSASSSAVEAPETWIWNWSWNCSDAASPSLAPPPPEGASNWTWNWTWNCEETQPAPSCAQCNVNISIRIGSPGDNGAITQSNLASATSTVTNVAATTQVLLQTVAPPPLPPLPPIVVPQLPAAPVVDLPVPPLVVPVPALLLAPAFALAVALLPQAEEQLAGGGITAIPPGDGDGTSGRPPAATDGAAPVFSAAPRAAASPQVVPLVAAGSASFDAAARTRPAARAARAERPARFRPRLPRAPLDTGTQLSAAGAAPGSGASPGGLAILVSALIVLAPSATRWLRVVRAARPSAVPASRPERPG